MYAAGFFDGVSDGLEDAWRNVIDFLPKLIGALLILLIGWIIARIIRNIVRRVLERLGFDKLLDRAGFTDALRNAGITASRLVANVVYVILLLTVALLAAEALAVEELTSLLSSLVGYLPLVIVAIVILIVAAALGAFLADLARPWAESQNVGWLSPVVRWVLIVFGIIAAFNVLNVAEVVVNTLFISVVGAAALAFAVAFGVGGIDTAKLWWRKLAPRDSGGGPTHP